MGRDHPDGTSRTISIQVISAQAVPEIAANESPISRLSTLTTTSLSYGTVHSYTVPTSTVTVLYGLELYSNVLSKTSWQLTLKGVVQWTAQVLPSPLNIFFADARLSAGDVILLEALSSDGTQVTAYGHLEGKEVA